MRDSAWQSPKPRGRFRYALGALLLTVTLMASMAACGGGDVVVIATIGTYHPFDFINDEGEIDGLERELGDELCRRADFECEWVLNDWETMIPDLVAEEFDAILSGMSITAGREETIRLLPNQPPIVASAMNSPLRRWDPARMASFEHVPASSPPPTCT